MAEVPEEVDSVITAVLTRKAKEDFFQHPTFSKIL
jgi:hypothetical protein